MNHRRGNQKEPPQPSDCSVRTPRTPPLCVCPPSHARAVCIRFPPQNTRAQNAPPPRARACRPLGLVSLPISWYGVQCARSFGWGGGSVAGGRSGGVALMLVGGAYELVLRHERPFAREVGAHRPRLRVGTGKVRHRPAACKVRVQQPSTVTARGRCGRWTFWVGMRGWWGLVGVWGDSEVS
ncbi:hypothetical protein C8R44DRAFT_733925 [Mycena epipterygia]|nr:hypothetical protein C8R44DRAFT_733925 [Mycena epipterygia]